MSGGVLSHTNEGWRVVERYVNRYSPPDFRLVLKKDDRVLDIPITEESWRAFETPKKEGRDGNSLAVEA